MHQFSGSIYFKLINIELNFSPAFLIPAGKAAKKPYLVCIYLKYPKAIHIASASHGNESQLSFAINF